MYVVAIATPIYLIVIHVFNIALKQLLFEGKRCSSITAKLPVSI